MKIISKSEQETQKIAANFAKQLRGGEVILMYGDLGAGKTVFVKGLAKALGIRETVKSPTFNIMKCYKAKSEIRNPKSETNSKFKIQNSKLIFCHIDAYRLKNFDELLDIGADEFLGKENVITVVEWAERIGIKSLNHKIIKSKENSKIIKIKIQHGRKDDERIIEINS